MLSQLLKNDGQNDENKSQVLIKSLDNYLDVDAWLQLLI